MSILIADSGATKCEWCYADDKQPQTFYTTGISPYFLNTDQIIDILRTELLNESDALRPEKIFFYGTGLSNANNRKTMLAALSNVFPEADIALDTDLMAAARALCGSEKGLACILGTGSNSCFFNGNVITKNSPGLGYVLGDEGSGAYLGKRVLQHYLYNTFDEELKSLFDSRFVTSPIEILENVYKGSLPNRYLASFSVFLAENRGHYMIENILEDGINDFFFQHLFKYTEAWKYPIHFAGGIAWTFRDVVTDICNNNQLSCGNIINTPMQGLLSYHVQV